MAEPRADSMNSAPTAMQCPTCSVDLVMSERQGIEIDYCPRCRGIWLDRGELDKIIERSAQQQSGPNEQRNSNLSRPSSDHAPSSPGDHSWSRGEDKHGYRGHRRKSWLEELFD